MGQHLPRSKLYVALRGYKDSGVGKRTAYGMIYGICMECLDQYRCPSPRLGGGSAYIRREAGFVRALHREPGRLFPPRTQVR